MPPRCGYARFTCTSRTRWLPAFAPRLIPPGRPQSCPLCFRRFFFCHERLKDLIRRRSLRDKARTVKAKEETSCTRVCVQRPASEQGQDNEVLAEGVQGSLVVHCEEPSCDSAQRN